MGYASADALSHMHVCMPALAILTSHTPAAGQSLDRSQAIRLLSAMQVTKFSRFAQRYDEDRGVDSILLGDQNCFHVCSGERLCSVRPRKFDFVALMRCIRKRVMKAAIAGCSCCTAGP